MTAGRGRAPRVAFVITSSGAGGAESQVRALALAFRERGWEVAVVSMLPIESMFEDLPASGIQVATLGMIRGVPDPRALIRLHRLFRRWKPDVVHGHMVHANLLVRLSRLLRRDPIVISTIHSQDEGRAWRYRAYRLTDRLSDVTTTVSHGARAEANRRGAAGRHGIRVVPNGVRTARYHRDAGVRDAIRRTLDVSDSFVWLTVGRFVEAKRHVDLIAAFHDVRLHHPAAVLLIAGSGPLEVAIRERIRSLGLEGSVSLLGQRGDIPALMQAGDAFVLSSAWEGLPMVLLEAGASSLPIVATDVGGTHDSVIDGVSGYVIPARNVGALTGSMERILDLDTKAAEMMGAAGRSHIQETFELDHVVSVWETLYREAATRRRRTLPPTILSSDVSRVIRPAEARSHE